jgi:hypothetical protein
MRINKSEAEEVVADWARGARSEQIRSMSETGPKPTYHRIVAKLSRAVPLMTMTGELGPEATEAIENTEDPARFVFFVDLKPGANWEHACQYVFVHASKRLTIISATAPPATSGRSRLSTLQGVFPHDSSLRLSQSQIARSG